MENASARHEKRDTVTTLANSIALPATNFGT